jgi:murein DD-endopeptidase MepM/ murein hydrolase activator NlpD
MPGFSGERKHFSKRPVRHFTAGIVRLQGLFLLLVALLAAGCATPAPSASTETAQAPTVPSPTPAPSATPSPLPTASPVPCDPASADYCIVEGYFVLERPISPDGVQTTDRSYAYGSTLGGAREPHHGVEFPNPRGTPVLAAAAGQVFFAGDDRTEKFSPWNNFYGNLVILEHHLVGQTFYTIYAHLAQIDVVTGQSVEAGQTIGAVGMSGSASGHHLHFEVRLEAQNYDSTQNPHLWLVPLPETGVLSIRFVNAAGQFVATQPNIQYFPDPSGLPAQAWQPELYAPGMPPAWENALLGDLPAGRYRITYLWGGVLYERWIEIQPGKLTLVSFEVP